MANLYQEYRCTKICVTVMPFQELPSSTANTNTLVVLGYLPVDQLSGVGSASDISALSDTAIQSSGCSTPVKFTLNKKQLFQGKMLKWLHVNTTFSEFANQGQVAYVSLGTNAGTAEAIWLVTSEWEFRAPVPFGEFFKRMGRCDMKTIADCDKFGRTEEPGRPLLPRLLPAEDSDQKEQPGRVTVTSPVDSDSEVLVVDSA